MFFFLKKKRGGGSNYSQGPCSAIQISLPLLSAALKWAGQQQCVLCDCGGCGAAGLGGRGGGHVTGCGERVRKDVGGV